jgi:tetratricopeptide (TPR) repeat protein
MEHEGPRIPYSKGELLALCGGLVRQEFTGRLEVYHQQTTRVLMLIDGELAGMVSDLSAETIERQLLLDEVITKGDISRVNGKSRHEGRSGDEMRIEERLLRRRRISKVDLATANHRRMEAAVGVVFALDGAEYSLFPHDEIGKVKGIGIQDGLVSTQPLLSVFWRAATRASEWIMGEVAQFKGPLVPAGDFIDTISCLEGIEFPLGKFREAMAKQPSVEELYLEFAQEASLFPMIWILEKFGAISVGGGAEQRIEVEEATVPSEGLGMQGASQRTLVEWESLIDEIFSSRAGLGCYGFIGSKETDSREKIDSDCKKMLRDLKPALMVQSMSEESFDKLDKLLIGVKNVWLTLSDSALRKNYDASLANGTKFQVAFVPGAEPIKVTIGSEVSQAIETSPMSKRLKKALDLVNRGLFDNALPLLESERLQSPNSAAVLTGIARSHLGLGRVEDSLDFFNLALVFSPSDYRALRGVAEVQLRENNLEEAHKSLKVLADTHPLDEWVTKQLADLKVAEKGEKRSLFSWGRKRK